MAERVLWTGENLNLNIGQQIIFNDASLTIDDHERIGMVGRNGSGKSTLLRTIAQEELVSSGNISRARNLRVAFLPQDFAIDPTLTIRENIQIGLEFFETMLHRYEDKHINAVEHEEIEHWLSRHNGWNLERKLSEIMDKLHLTEPDRLCDTLSGGENRRVALARAIISEPDLLLLDEPTNHLDVETVSWIEDFLAGYDGACLFVTHDRCFLDRISTRIIELDNGKIFSYNGSYADFLEAKAERETAEDILDSKRRKFLRSEIEWVRRSPKARLKRNMGRVKRFDELAAQSGPERIGEIELLLPPPSRLGNRVIELKNVSQQFDEQKLINDFSFEFLPGQKVGIVGPNGIGKSTLIKILTGSLKPQQGKVFIADTVEFNYIDQSRMVLDPENTVAEEVAEGSDSVILGNEKISVWGYLKRFLFEDERIATKVKYLSGGEKARLSMAKILKKGGNFLVLDEPTNDLDLSSLRLLEETLRSYTGCIVVVSHDRYFLNRVCDHIIAFESPGKISATVGDYDYYLEKRKERQDTACSINDKKTKATTSASSNNTNTEKNTPKKLSYKEQMEFDSLENEIMLAEERVSEFEALFADSEFMKRAVDEIVSLNNDFKQAQDRVEQLYNRWEELDNKRQKLQQK